MTRRRSLPSRGGDQPAPVTENLETSFGSVPLSPARGRSQPLPRPAGRPPIPCRSRLRSGQDSWGIEARPGADRARALAGPSAGVPGLLAGPGRSRSFRSDGCRPCTGGGDGERRRDRRPARSSDWTRQGGTAARAGRTSSGGVEGWPDMRRVSGTAAGPQRRLPGRDEHERGPCVLTVPDVSRSGRSCGGLGCRLPSQPWTARPPRWPRAGPRRFARTRSRRPVSFQRTSNVSGRQPPGRAFRVRVRPQDGPASPAWSVC